MIKALKALSALLTYPSAELQQAAGEISEAIENETALSVGMRDQLHRLLKEFASDDIYDLQERYVLLFDHTRSLSLHLFEHVHGESRDRGQAMIDLKAQYEKASLFMSAAELPDFLPLFLEFLSTLPAHEASDMLGQPAHILAAMAERLRKRRSAYEACSARSSRWPRQSRRTTRSRLCLRCPIRTRTTLRRSMPPGRTRQVRFGPGASDGCKDGLIARIRGGLRPAPDMPATRNVRPH